MNLKDRAVERLFPNLFDYEDPEIEEFKVDGEVYRGKPDYEPVAILGQAFGSSKDQDSYNQILAETIADAEEHYGKTPIIGQFEIVHCLKGEDSSYEEREDVIPIFDQSGESEMVSDYTTIDVLEEIGKTLDQEEIGREDLLFVGHPAHMQRTLDTADYVGLEGEPMIRDEVTWPGDDGQEWVRNAEDWKGREIASRIHLRMHSDVPGAPYVLDRLGF